MTAKIYAPREPVQRIVEETSQLTIPRPFSAVAPQGKAIVPLPCLSATTPAIVITMTFIQATRLLASRCEATSFAVFVDRIDDPIDARVTTDSLVLRVDENNPVVVSCVLQF